MPYKPNRLRLKREAISKKRSEQWKRGNEVKRQKMQQEAVKGHVCGGLHNYGSLGHHHIQILDYGFESHFWLMVDGQLRKPQTDRGFRKILCDWMLRRSGKNAKWIYNI